MNPGDRMIAAFIAPQKLGSSFSAWPLHLTVLPWFRAEIVSQVLASQLSKELADIKPFDIIVGSEDHFGRHGRKLVNLIKLPSKIEDVEKLTRQVIKSHGAWIVDETTKFKRTYRPHITVQANSRTEEGTVLTISGMAIIRQCGENKLIELEIKFK